jgi:hypothetical protein
MELLVNEVKTAEYDAFGPWVLPVARDEDVPRAFREYPFDFVGSSTVLKIPRDIARREANPTMHLYDKMLVVDDDQLAVLERVGDRFSSTVLPLDSIAAVEVGNELLEGWLTVYGTDGTRVTVPFNGSSRPAITTLADRLLASPSALPVIIRRSDELAIDALGPADTALVTDYRDATQRRALRLHAADPGSVPPSRGSALARLGRPRRRLSGIVLSGTDHELVVVSRRLGLRASVKPDLSSRELVIRREQITGLTTSANPLVGDVTTATIEAGSARIELQLRTGGPVLKYLEQLVD